MKIKENRTLIAVLAYIIVFLIFVFLVYLPKHSQVLSLKGRIKSIEKQIDITQQMLGDLNKLGEMLAGMQRELDDFRSRLPDKSRVSSVISQLSNLAKDLDIEVLSIKPAKPVHVSGDDGKPILIAGDHLVSMDVGLSLYASYRPLADYINNIQHKLDMLASVKELDVQRDASRYPKLRSHILLTVYIIEKAK
jgi:Tfp pilus assembly protein PilO